MRLIWAWAIDARVIVTTLCSDGEFLEKVVYAFVSLSKKSFFRLKKLRGLYSCSCLFFTWHSPEKVTVSEENWKSLIERVSLKVLQTAHDQDLSVIFSLLSFIHQNLTISSLQNFFHHKRLEPQSYNCQYDFKHSKQIGTHKKRSIILILTKLTVLESFTLYRKDRSTKRRK